MRRNLFRTMMVSLFECPVMRYPARSPIGCRPPGQGSKGKRAAQPGPQPGAPLPAALEAR